MKKGYIALGCAVLGTMWLAGLAIVAGIGWFVFINAYQGLSPMQLELPPPGVQMGEGRFEKVQRLADSRTGPITDIVLAPEKEGRREFVVAGPSGAAFAGLDFTVRTFVPFAKRGDHVDILDYDGDGVFEFMNRGSWGSDPALIGADGATLWTQGGMPGVDDMAAGDLDGDGKTEFAVGFNGEEGVRLLDSQGNVRWRKPDGNVWHIEIVDTDADGKSEIVHSSVGGELVVRDAQGNIIRRKKPRPYFSYFSLCRWPDAKDRSLPLLAEENTLYVFDYKAQVIWTQPAPFSGSFGKARGAWVTFAPGEPAHFAVVVCLKSAKESILYLYDSTGALVYQEILPEPCRALLAVTLPDSPGEVLLVGGQDRVWQYRPKQPEAAAPAAP